MLFKIKYITQIFEYYCEFKILICLWLYFRDILRVRVFLGQTRSGPSSSAPYGNFQPDFVQ